MSVQEINPRQELNDSICFNGKEKELFKRDCPHCHSEEVTVYSHYQTKNNGERKIFIILNTLVQNYALSVQGFSCYTFLRLDMARIRILDKMTLKLFSKLYFTRL